MDSHRFASTTEHYSSLGAALEHSLGGFVTTQPGHGLLPTQTGRCQRLTPERFGEQPKFCPASRAGEVELRCDFTTMAVRYWFKQLRRIQSLRHALRAGSDHWEAQLHRYELWGAILRARGFEHGFRTFWSLGHPDGRPHLPEWLPEGLPSLPQIELIYETFHARELMRCPKAQPDLFWADHYYTILGFEPDTCSLHLDRPLDLAGRSTWTINGASLSVLKFWR